MKSRGYTLRILPGLVCTGGQIRRRPAPAFSRCSGAAQPRKSVSIILHIYADTESYPQLPHSFQQPGGRASNAFNRYGNNLQTRNWTSFPCESGGLFDIISIWRAGGNTRPRGKCRGASQRIQTGGDSLPPPCRPSISRYSRSSSLRRGPNSPRAMTKFPAQWRMSIAMPLTHQTMAP